MDKVSFIEAMSDCHLGPQSRLYIQSKEALIFLEENTMDDYKCLAAQFGHVVSLIYKVPALAIQTTADALCYVALAVFNILTLCQFASAVSQMKSRSYNLGVADTLAWLSIIPSLFNFRFMQKSNALHLGTLRIHDVWSK